MKRCGRRRGHAVRHGVAFLGRTYAECPPPPGDRGQHRQARRPAASRASALLRHQGGQRAFQSAQIQRLMSMPLSCRMAKPLRAAQQLAAWRRGYLAKRKRAQARQGRRMSLIAAIRREYIYLTSIARTLWMLRPVKPDMPPAASSILSKARRAKRPQAPAIYYLDRRDELWRSWMRAPIAMPIGRWRQGIEAGRLRRAVDGKPARFSLRLAGPVQGGRSGGADQHQSARPGAGPFHRDRRRQAC